MFLLQTAKNVSSWHPSVISGDDGLVPGVVLLSLYYYSCRVFGIRSKNQTPIAQYMEELGDNFAYSLSFL